MSVFPSQRWLDAYVESINASEQFAEAARTFQASLSYVFEADPGHGLLADIWVQAGVRGGKCEWWRYDVSPDEGAKADFVLEAPYSLWKHMIQGKVDPVEAILDGEVTVAGHLPTLLKYVRAANTLVSLAVATPTRFLDEPLSMDA